ncbi:MAG: rhomboid family intramembrane serine protease [Phaeodactylibacter sp.]|nr:rhomboid family intramembrane serine protease [Phaeodactylibacter sp.]
MFQSIWEDVKREFNYGNMVTRLIIINAAVFVLVNIVRLILVVTTGWQGDGGFEAFTRFFSLSSDWWYNLTHPWVIITSMFLHVGFFHFLFNMLFMYWFGRIVGDLLGNHRILPLYILGGLAGAALYLLFAQFIYGIDGYAYGASAAVMAIVVAAGMIAPDYIMHVLFIGAVRLKYIVAVLVFLDVIGLGSMSNTGGHLAHLGGAIFGALFVSRIQKGDDWSIGVNKFFDWLGSAFAGLFKNDPKRPKVVYRNPKAPRTRAKGDRRTDGERSASHQEKLDAILDKIKRSGYESLTEEEKEFLFNASKK